jgi:hypothetical protein
MVGFCKSAGISTKIEGERLYLGRWKPTPRASQESGRVAAVDLNEDQGTLTEW